MSLLPMQRLLLMLAIAIVAATNSFTAHGQGDTGNNHLDKYAGLYRTPCRFDIEDFFKMNLQNEVCIRKSSDLRHGLTQMMFKTNFYKGVGVAKECTGAPMISTTVGMMQRNMIVKPNPSIDGLDIDGAVLQRHYYSVATNVAPMLLDSLCPQISTDGRDTPWVKDEKTFLTTGCKFSGNPSLKQCPARYFQITWDDSFGANGEGGIRVSNWLSPQARCTDQLGRPKRTNLTGVLYEDKDDRLNNLPEDRGNRGNPFASGQSGVLFEYDLQYNLVSRDCGDFDESDRNNHRRGCAIVCEPYLDIHGSLFTSIKPEMHTDDACTGQIECNKVTCCNACRSVDKIRWGDYQESSSVIKRERITTPFESLAADASVCCALCGLTPGCERWNMFSRRRSCLLLRGYAESSYGALFEDLTAIAGLRSSQAPPLAEFPSVDIATDAVVPTVAEAKVSAAMPKEASTTTAPAIGVDNTLTNVEAAAAVAAAPTAWCGLLSPTTSPVCSQLLDYEVSQYHAAESMFDRVLALHLGQLQGAACRLETARFFCTGNFPPCSYNVRFEMCQQSCQNVTSICNQHDVELIEAFSQALDATSYDSNGDDKWGLDKALDAKEKILRTGNGDDGGGSSSSQNDPKPVTTNEGGFFAPTITATENEETGSPIDRWCEFTQNPFCGTMSTTFNKEPKPGALEAVLPSCQVYNGTTCKGVIQGLVYVPAHTTLAAMEEDMHNSWFQLFGVAPHLPHFLCLKSMAQYACAATFLPCSDTAVTLQLSGKPVPVLVPMLPCQHICTALLADCTETLAVFSRGDNSPQDCESMAKFYRGLPSFPSESMAVSLTAPGLQWQCFDYLVDGVEPDMNIPFECIAPTVPATDNYERDSVGTNCVLPCPHTQYRPGALVDADRVYRYTLPFSLIALGMMMYRMSSVNKKTHRYPLYGNIYNVMTYVWHLALCVLLFYLVIVFALMKTAATKHGVFDFSCNNATSAMNGGDSLACWFSAMCIILAVGGMLGWYIVVSLELFMRTSGRTAKMSEKHRTNHHRVLYFLGYSPGVIGTLAAWATADIGHRTDLAWCWFNNNSLDAKFWVLLITMSCLTLPLLGASLWFRVFLKKERAAAAAASGGSDGAAATAADEDEDEDVGGERQIALRPLILMLCIFFFFVIFGGYLLQQNENLPIYQKSFQDWYACHVRSAKDAVTECTVKPSHQPRSDFFLLHAGFVGFLGLVIVAVMESTHKSLAFWRYKFTLWHAIATGRHIDDERLLEDVLSSSEEEVEEYDEWGRRKQSSSSSALRSRSINSDHRRSSSSGGRVSLSRGRASRRTSTKSAIDSDGNSGSGSDSDGGGGERLGNINTSNTSASSLSVSSSLRRSSRKKRSSRHRRKVSESVALVSINVAKVRAFDEGAKSHVDEQDTDAQDSDVSVSSVSSDGSDVYVVEEFREQINFE